MKIKNIVNFFIFICCMQSIQSMDQSPKPSPTQKTLADNAAKKTQEREELRIYRDWKAAQLNAAILAHSATKPKYNNSETQCLAYRVEKLEIEFARKNALPIPPSLLGSAGAGAGATDLPPYIPALRRTKLIIQESTLSSYGQPTSIDSDDEKGPIRPSLPTSLSRTKSTRPDSASMEKEA